MLHEQGRGDRHAVSRRAFLIGTVGLALGKIIPEGESENAAIPFELNTREFILTPFDLSDMTSLSFETVSEVPSAITGDNPDTFIPVYPSPDISAFIVDNKALLSFAKADYALPSVITAHYVKPIPGGLYTAVDVMTNQESMPLFDRPQHVKPENGLWFTPVDISGNPTDLFGQRLTSDKSGYFIPAPYIIQPQKV